MLVEGTLFRASQFLSEELPIRLAHRVQELGDLPDQLNEMPSIKKVQDWYAQSFEVSRRILTVANLQELNTFAGAHNLVKTQSCSRCARATHPIAQTKRSRL